MTVIARCAKRAAAIPLDCFGAAQSAASRFTFDVRDPFKASDAAVRTAGAGAR